MDNEILVDRYSNAISCGYTYDVRQTDVAELNTVLAQEDILGYDTSIFKFGIKCNF